MFDDRLHAGRELGRMVASRFRSSPTVVLALPRGGVPVGIEVARCLRTKVELDVFVVRKLGLPGQEELAFGAIASGGVRVLNTPMIADVRLSADEVDRVTERERVELLRREQVYREGRTAIAIQDRVVILVDDGLATGATMIAAVRSVRLLQPRKVVVAVPVASEDAAAEIRADANELICAEFHDPFYAVGYWYRNFAQVTDDQVRDLLRGFTLERRGLASKPHNALRRDGSAGSS